MSGKTVISTVVVVVCIGLGLTSARAEMGFGDFRQERFGGVRAEAIGAWQGGNWDTGAWPGARWRSGGWSWDSNSGWPAPAAAWYYGPYYGACLQPQWTGKGWVWVNVC
jgi:hypothetical protein